MKFTKKFKKITSAVLAAALICAAAVPAFAAEQTDEDPETDIQTIVVPGDDIGEETDEEVEDAARELKSYAGSLCRSVCDEEPGAQMYTHWSQATKDRITELSSLIEVKTYSTMAEVNEDIEKINEFKRTATVSSMELDVILDLFRRESNAAGYYDEETWNEFTSVYEECKQASESEDDEAIHIAYVKGHNMLNKLCLYNKTMGDINNDGEVNVKDVTLLQKGVVEEVSLTLSQAFVGDYTYGLHPTLVPNVKNVTELQKLIVEDTSVSQFDSSIVTKLEANPEFELYPESRIGQFGYTQKWANTLYYRFYYDQFIFWI